MKEQPKTATKKRRRRAEWTEKGIRAVSAESEKEVEAPKTAKTSKPKAKRKAVEKELEKDQDEKTTKPAPKKRGRKPKDPKIAARKKLEDLATKANGFVFADLAKICSSLSEEVIDELIQEALGARVIEVIGRDTKAREIYGLVRDPGDSEPIEATAQSGFILCINCTPVGEVSTPIGHLLGEIRKDNPDMWAKDVSVFDRRDALFNGAGDVAQKLQGLVVAEGLGLGQSDARALVDGLKQFAIHVITGVSG